MATFDTTTPVLPLPTYGYATTHGYATHAHLFEDGTEQRYLTASGQARTLHYTYTPADSATVSQVSSLFQDANGPETVFTATDYTTGTLHQVIFEDPELLVLRRGRFWQVGPIPLRVVGDL